MTAPGEHRDPVAEPHRLVDVVGDQHHRRAQGALDLPELGLQVAPAGRVHRAERLVHEQHRRVDGERPRHPDALLLPAGELVRVPPRVHRVVQAHQVEQLGDPVLGAARVPAQQGRHGRDVLGDGAVREQADVLDDVADPAPQGDGSVVVTSSPVTSTRPEVGSTSRLTIRRVVDFPQPDGPTSTISSCSRTSRSRLSTATVPSGYSLRTDSSRMTGSAWSATARPYPRPCGRACAAGSVPTVSAAPGNPWLSWEYVQRNWPDIANALGQHVSLTVEAIVLATAIAVPLAVLAHLRPRLAGSVLGLSGVLYTIPSLALFAILFPLIARPAHHGADRAGDVRPARAGAQRPGGPAGRGPGDHRRGPRDRLRPLADPGAASSCPTRCRRSSPACAWPPSRRSRW